MKTIPDTDRASTGLGDRLPRADEKPADPQPKPVDTFATGEWLPGGLRITPTRPVVIEDSGDDET